MHSLVDPVMLRAGEALSLEGLSPVSSIIGSRFRPADVALGDVLAYQNPDVVARLQRKLELSLDQAQALFDDVKRFLYLTSTQPGKWSPTQIIDDGWHEFILFTEDYGNFCHRYVGHFIHHHPRRLGDASNYPAMIRNTVAAAYLLFGDLSPNWNIEGQSYLGGFETGILADACSGDGSDGTGDSDGCNGCK